jgi:hypothetical protein
LIKVLRSLSTSKKSFYEFIQGILSEWKAKVLLFVQKRIRASFVVQTSSDSSFVVCSLRRFESSQNSLMVLGSLLTWINVVNNVVFVCKKLYISFVFRELNSLVGTYVVSNLAPI